MSKTKGLVAAVLAYSAWGPLAPLGTLLLEDMGVFTLNTVRTAGSLVLFAIVIGPRVFVRSLRILGRDPKVWLLGTLGLGFTFGAYLGSLQYLEPTIAALLIYLSPLLVAWIARRNLGEKPPRLFLPTIVLTIGGGALAVLEPSRGIHLGDRALLGLALGLLGVLGWTFYTLYLKHLGPKYEDSELTLTAFLTSGAVFLVATLLVPSERFHIEADTWTWVRLAFYIVFPSFISFQLYSIAVRNAGAAFTATLLGIEIAATAVFSYFLVGERFGWEKTLGILLVLGAVTVFLIDDARKSPTLPAPSAPGQPETQGDQYE
ncbi:MAG: DMT family transporter [Euryarchaeota archaeon]|nr:DMT family transporter [Euryarchaeota archaeon]